MMAGYIGAGAVGPHAPGKGVRALASLWRPGDDGFLVGPMVSSHTWQDVAATSPVSADGNYVGRGDDISGKGRHATQGSNTRRPIWRVTGGGKWYLSGDGVDDCLVTNFIPTTAMTILLAVRPDASPSPSIVLGGGQSSPNMRCYISFGPSGRLAVGWGDSIGETGMPDRSGVDAAIVVSGDGSSRTVYLDGVALPFAPSSGGPNGSGAMTVSAYNNNGTLQSFSSSRIYAAGAINRVLTAAEIAFATDKLKRMYQ